MSLTPRGMSVQEAYRNFISENFIVNRRYQRKLVWSLDEKRLLIDSIIHGYPLPLFLLAKVEGAETYEIIDGIQRLNAIFSFIHHQFTNKADECFDLNELATAKQMADAEHFLPFPDNKIRMSRKDCAAFLDYQLAVTIDSESDESRINEVFGRINSGGRQLSAQEKRQAGLVSPFSELVRELSSELRGDTSPLRVTLSAMPEVSINTPKDRQGYGVDASDVVWCRHGIIPASELRDSGDEQLIADICISILYNEPFAYSREALDEFYDPTSDNYKDLEARLQSYGQDRLKNTVKVIMSQFQEIFDPSPNMFRSIVHKKPANAARTAFYAVFFAILNLIYKEQKKPNDADGIRKACENIQSNMETGTHYSTTENRYKNISVVTGMIQPYFINADPAELGTGEALAVDFENSLRMSRFERNRYELKAGRIELIKGGRISAAIYEKLCRTICGIANVGPESPGFIYFGVADEHADANRVENVFGHQAKKIGDHFFVGVDYELEELNIDVSTYVRQLIEMIKNSDLSEPLKSNVISQITHGKYAGKTFVRIRIPPQNGLSSKGERYFIREESQTKEMTTRQAFAQQQLFQ